MSRGGEEQWVVLARLGKSEAGELDFTLRHAGIPSRVEPAFSDNGQRGLWWEVQVPAMQLERARQVQQEERPPGAQLIPLPDRRPKPKLYWVVGLVVLNLLVWIALEGYGEGSESVATLLRFGASHAPSILGGGQWWRLVTAIFLHIGLKHLLGNMATLAIFGPAALGRWRVGRFYLLYLLTGVAGNLLSLAISPTPAVKAGASGALLGLLGLLAGARIRGIRRPGPPSRFKTWHVVAMIVAFYGFVVGVGPADHLAHLGGLLSGLALGLLVPAAGRQSPARERLWGWACGLTALLAVAGAGLLQWAYGA
jgi:rhomboid protease GluP